MKYSWINNKEDERTIIKTRKLCLKKFKEDIDSHVHGLVNLIDANITHRSLQIHATSIKIGIFLRNGKIYPKIQIAKTTFIKMRKIGGSTLLYFKTN